MTRDDVKAIIESDNDTGDKITELLNRHHAEMKMKITEKDDVEKNPKQDTPNPDETELAEKVKTLDEKEKELLENELNFSFKKDSDSLRDNLKKRGLELSDDGLDAISKAVDFTDKKSYESSLNQIRRMLRGITVVRQYYEPNAGGHKSEHYYRIQKAFKKPTIL